MNKVLQIGVLTLSLALVSSSLASDSWDFLKFVQEWPTSVCMFDAKYTDPKEAVAACKIPKNVNSFTIHGLWPTKLHTYGPNNCNASEGFNDTVLKSIMPRLEQYWPNYFTDAAEDSFWKHEWVKHGTCAQSLPSLRTEFDYFNMGLKLNRQFDILSVFRNSGYLVPNSSYPISVSEIKKALKPWYEPPISCKSINGGRYLTQVTVCLDKSFQPVDCKKYDSAAALVEKAGTGQNWAVGAMTNCPNDEPVYMLPIPH